MSAFGWFLPTQCCCTSAASAVTPLRKLPACISPARLPNVADCMYYPACKLAAGGKTSACLEMCTSPRPPEFRMTFLVHRLGSLGQPLHGFASLGLDVLLLSA